MLKNEDGDWTEDVEEIKAMAVNYFRKLFEEDNPIRCHVNFNAIWPPIPCTVWDMVNTPFTDDEVKKAVFSIGGLKAPGSDGFPAKFYHLNWDTISEISSKNSDSRLWKEITCVWDDFADLVGWEVGNGEKIKFWWDKWIPGQHRLIEDTTCDIEQNEFHKGLNKFTNDNGCWNIDMFKDCLPSERVDAILKMNPPDAALGPDQPRWEPSENNAFTIRSAYHAIQKCNMNNNEQNWKRIWKSRNAYRNQFLLWSFIWEWRNKLINNEDFRYPTSPHSSIITVARAQNKALGSPLSRVDVDPHCEKALWKVPERGWIKVNIDGAVCRRNMVAGCGGLFRNDNGKWLHGFTCNLGFASAHSAEMWGIYFALKIAWERGHKKVILECDSRNVVAQCTDRMAGLLNPHPTLSCIKKLMSKEWEVNIKLIPRTINTCADRLAKEGLKSSQNCSLLDEAPIFLQNELASEALSAFLPDLRGS
ncbi:putative Polynucleotidyl transferase [Senna tora]|uniref:Putative Polynucleotidyl transferase n=1 Tax=Senna tora TaxID=362788 RepID=A0A835CIK5_9FABA|nr:putative Polynucleotidyl transferase [Senna tora]